VPAEGRSAEACRFLGEDEKRELEGFGEVDVLELRDGGRGREIAPIECPAEASVGRATRGQVERRTSSSCKERRLEDAHLDMCEMTQ